MLFEEIREIGSETFVQQVGNPKFRQGEFVMFFFDNKKEELQLASKVEKVHEYGTFFQHKEVSYDIWKAGEEKMYKMFWNQMFSI